MRELFLIFVLSLTISLTFSSNFPVFSQNTESITLTTYYPSPVGIYRELRAQRVAIGDTYYDASQYCWPEDNCMNAINATADLVVDGNVGIGTVSPQVLADNRRILQLANEDGGATLRISSKGRPWLLFDNTNVTRAFAIGIEDAISDTNLYFDFDNPPGLMEKRIMVLDGVNGTVGIGVTIPQVKLDVDGSIKIGTDSDCASNTDKCSLDTSGAMRYCNEVIEYCDGDKWGGWSGVALDNGWAYTAGLAYFNLARPGYSKDAAGVVHIKGTVAGGACGVANNPAEIFRLPAGYCPNLSGGVRVFSALNCYSAPGQPAHLSECWSQRIDITPESGTGCDVRMPHACKDGRNQQLHLDGISFPTR
ncbi:MAG: hypothetical protein PHQ96_03955 [Candidatus Omnitrophica bacterium]|nr:hypothetical protein [Candidatus Omnitrophota bacterium]